MTKKLKELLERVESWPKEAQEQLIAFADDIEAGRGEYHASSEELEGIDRGIKDADAGNFATRAEVEALFAKFLA
jgi:predicted transcriptional regulator